MSLLFTCAHFTITYGHVTGKQEDGEKRDGGTGAGAAKTMFRNQEQAELPLSLLAQSSLQHTTDSNTKNPTPPREQSS